jgi:glutamate N-acetyltransferase/amino-acid N-acetyltransferase
MAKSKPKVAPLAPARFPRLPPVAGVMLATRACGIRYTGRRDVLYVEMVPGTQVAGVFTRSQTASAPVDWCRAHIARGRGRVLVVNAGNANAATGAEGHAACERVAKAAAKAAKVPAPEVYQASTGVIG